MKLYFSVILLFEFPSFHSLLHLIQTHSLDRKKDGISASVTVLKSVDNERYEDIFKGKKPSN